MEREARSHLQSAKPELAAQTRASGPSSPGRGAGAGTLTGEAKQEKGSCLARKQRG